MDAFLRVLLFVLLAAAPAAGRTQDSFPSLRAKAVDLCESPPACEQVGKLRLLGVLELPSRSVNGLRFSRGSAPPRGRHTLPRRPHAGADSHRSTVLA